MPISQSQKTQLQQGCKALGIELADNQQTALENYLASLLKWNKAYNLTAIRDPDEMVVKHLLDSLAIHAAIRGDTILDVGTGPGLPGIPLAILYPQRQFSLLDSNGKKTRFLVQMKHELQLDNIQIINDRIEALPQTPQFDGITCRAFTSLADFARHCLPLLKPQGQLLAMKGKVPDDEIAALDQGTLQIGIEKITVPYLNDERHLIRITPTQKEQD